MSEASNSAFTMLTCALAIAGWVIAFTGLCASHAFTPALSWWIISFEFLVVSLSCTVFWTSSTKVYYPVLLCLIAISIPYSTDEVVLYIAAEKKSLTATAAGYIILMANQFIWIFLFGTQYDIAILRSFNNLNQHHFQSRVYDSTGSGFPKDQNLRSGVGFNGDNNMTIDITGPNYPMPIPTHTSYDGKGMISMPIYNMSPPGPNTVFLSPNANYSLPVEAIHSYQANKEDPNELSFTKGEILYIYEKKGTWWQAKRSDGLVGLIPSNYVTDQNSR